jgi:hypothetical protein
MAIKANSKSFNLATDLFLGISNERIAEPDFFPVAYSFAAGMVQSQSPFAACRASGYAGGLCH